MTAVGNPIEAVLTLNATSFHTGLNDSLKAVNSFKRSLTNFNKDFAEFNINFDEFDKKLNNIATSFARFNRELGDLKNLEALGRFLKNTSTFMEKLSSDTVNVEVGMTALNTIFEQWNSVVGNAEIKVKGLTSVLRSLNSDYGSSSERTAQLQQHTANLRNSYTNAITTIMGFARALNSENASLLRVINSCVQYEKGATDVQRSLSSVTTRVNMARASLIDLHNEYQRGNTVINPTVKSLEMMNSVLEQNRRSVMALITGEGQETVSLEENSIATRKNAEEKLRAMGYTGKLSIEEEKETASVEKNTQSHYRNANAMSQSSARANQLSSATSRLGKAFSSLRMMGTMVGSMLAYNYAHKLLVATGETIHAKSEMEGYFKMLHFGQSEIDGFNKALDDTVHQFQRVNKYSLGETISSIGVEFNLSTKEMEKAMKVTSMITSEYLRAGRNANEASLAVKDVLQGQFQRLSRETGVKGEQLKEAGWSGDTTDVLGLMEALEKVGESRNWDVFAEKANSLNDILTILQNRFGEWSAEMVNIVQPSIINSFNAIMDVSGMLAQSFTGIWEWLNGDGWEQGAVKVGLFLGALMPLSQALLLYRTNMTLVEASQLSLTQSIGALVFGLKSQQLAEVGVRNSILAKILGVKAESLATKGASDSIKEKLVAMRTESVQQKVNKAQEELETLAIEKNTIAKRIATLQTDLETASEQGLISAKEKARIEEELLTAQKELSVLTSIEQTEINGGLTASLIALGGAENIVAVATGEMSVAMGVLNGVIAISPIGWLIAGLTALAGAFYIATGGLDEHWAKMQQFNEVLNDSDSYINANNEHLKKLGETLGTDSGIYQFTADAVESFNKKLGSSKAIVKAYDDELSSLGATLSGISLKNASNLGLSEEQYNELREYVPALTEGYNTYYHALQVIHKQEENFDKSERTLIQNMRDRDAEKEDIINKTEQHMEHYNNFIKHSAEHNTAEDWWSGSWAGFLAWVDSFQIWLDYKTEDVAHWVHDLNEQWSQLPQQLGEAWNNLNLPDVGKMITDWIDDAKKSLDDSWTYVKGLVNDFIDGFFVSASDGSDDHPSIMDDISRELGFDVQSWIDNFTSNPLGTLGIGGVDLDVGGFISQLINPNDDGIYEWVQNTIITPLIDGIKQSIENTPILGDVAKLLGFGDDSESDAQSKGETVGTSYSTGFQTGIAPLDGFLNNIFNLDEATSQFTANSSTITASASTTATQVSTNYQNMKNTQGTILGNMVSQNTTAFTNLKTIANDNMTKMRDSTSNVTLQMSDAWTKMKNSIIESANKIKSESESRFTNLGNTIKNFYNKIQNPSQWGGSAGTPSSRTINPSPRSRAVGRSVTSGFAGGRGSSAPTGSMTISSLKRVLCPDGNCGSLFDGFSSTDVVDVATFLSMIGGNHGFGGWDFASNHNRFIKDKSDKWKTGSPVINLLGGIGTSTHFQVGEFNNGTPKISWDAFVSMAQAIFSAIPYRFYYDSSWKGSWLGALQAGACNCYDGALALIAFANACGFGGSMVHGTWTDPDGTTYPHVWATINGMKMDTTGWQQRRSWSAGSPTVRTGSSARPPSTKQGDVTIIVNINEPVYGVDELDYKISDSIDKGLAKHFNKNYAIGV